MPLIDDPLALGVPIDMVPVQTEANKPAAATPGWAEVMGAELQTSNTIGSAISDESGFTSRYALQAYDPDFDLGEALKGTKWENNPGLFVTARNVDHFRALEADYERDRKNRETIANSTWGQYLPAMIAAQVVDPINWLSLGTVGALKMAGGKGFTLATRTAAIGGGVAADTALQEGILQGTQANRTGEESLASIGGSLVLGSLIGHVGSRLLLRAETDALSKMIEGELAAFERGETPRGNLSGDTAGVGAERVWNADGTPSPRMKFSFGADYLSQRMGPQQRLTHSESDIARRFANETIETPYFYRENKDGFIVAPKGDAMGMPGSVQTRIGSVWEEPIMQAVYGMRDLFLEYRGMEHKGVVERAKMGLMDRLGRNGDAMSEVEFRKAVTDAVFDRGAHSVPQVAKTAKMVLDLVKKVEELGLKAGVLKQGQSALPRAWLTARITGERPRFRQIVIEHLKARRNVIDGEWAAIQKDLDALAKPDPSGQARKLTAEQERIRQRAVMVDAELESLADAVIERMTLAREGRTAHDLYKTRDANGFMTDDGVLTHQDFDIPYKEAADFLERDSELLMRLMHRSMIPDIEIAHRWGSADAAEALKARIDEGTRAINAATDPKERLKIEKRLKRDLQDMMDARDRLAGRYGLPSDPAAPMVRAGRFLRDASIVQKMGMSAFASVPETARLITARGFAAVFSDLIYPMIKDWSKLAEAGHDLRMMTHALDHHTASRAMAIADGAEDWGSIPKIDRFSREATKTFMRATGLPKLTDWQKSASGILTSKSILEAAEAMKAGKPTSKQVEFLSRLGISKENAATIADQFAKHGVKDDARIWAAELGKWDADARVAREAFMGGLRREVNRLITTPGLDTPNVTQNEVGRIFFQFKGFALSAYERVLVSGLQQNDVAFWSSAIAAVALAFMVNEGRKAVFQQGGDPKKHKTFDQRWDDPKERNQMFLDAVDRSGVIGWLPDVNQVMDRVFGAGLSSGIGVVQRQPGISKPEGAMKQLAGPALSTGFDTTLTGTKLAARMLGMSKWSEADTRRLEKIIPFIGLHWMRLGLEQLGAEQTVNKALEKR